MPGLCFKHRIRVIDYIKTPKLAIVITFFACLGIGKSQNKDLFLTIGGNGNDACQGLAFDPDGNLFVAGSFERNLELDSQTIQAEGDDVFFLKINAEKEIQWVKSIGSSLDDTVVDIDSDSDGNLIASGFYWQELAIEDSVLATTKNPKAYFLVQYNKEGNLSWIKNIEGSNLKEITDLAIDRNGQIYLSGFFQDSLFIGDTILLAKGETDSFLAKYTSEGQFQWALQEGFQGDTRSLVLAVSENDWIATAGYFNDTTRIAGNQFTANTSDWDVFISTYHLDGTPRWSKKAGGVFEEEATGIAIDQDGHVYITGFLVGVLTLNDNLSIQSSNGNADFFLLKYDSSGTPLAARAFGGNLYQQTTGLEIANNELILMGYYQGQMAFDQIQASASGDFDGFVAGVSSNLTVNWFNDFASGSFVLPSKIAKKGASSFMIGGSYRASLFINQQLYPARGNFDLFLLSYDDLSTSTTSMNPHHNIAIYPNPASNWLHIETTLKKFDVALLNANGKVVYKGRNVNKINIHSLPSGIYTLRIDNEQIHLSKKVFISK